MLILAIETSGPVGSVALLEDDDLLELQVLELGRKHAQSLIPKIQEVFAVRNTRPTDIGLIAVSIGPGSYTGLRVGVVAAKTFAFATHSPLVAVATLEAIAWNVPAGTAQVEVIADAQRGDVFVGQYRWNAGNRWEGNGEIRVVPAAAWTAELTPDSTVSGPGLEKYGGSIAGNCRLLPAECWVPSAVFIGRVGARSFAAGQAEDAFAIEPLYLRRSSAEVQWNRLHPTM